MIRTLDKNNVYCRLQNLERQVYKYIPVSMKVKIAFLVFIFFDLSWTTLSSDFNEVLRGCSVGSNKKGSSRNNVTLAEFHHNKPKNTEFFRISLVFPWKRPVVGVTSTNSSLNYYFGMLRS